MQQLKDLADLANQGILTEEEFAVQKARLLSAWTAKSGSTTVRPVRAAGGSSHAGDANKGLQEDSDGEKSPSQEGSP